MKLIIVQKPTLRIKVRKSFPHIIFTNIRDGVFTITQESRLIFFILERKIAESFCESIFCFIKYKNSKTNSIKFCQPCGLRCIFLVPRTASPSKMTITIQETMNTWPWTCSEPIDQYQCSPTSTPEKHQNGLITSKLLESNIDTIYI